MGYDGIVESPNQGTDTLDFLFCDKAIKLDLGTTAVQQANPNLALKLSSAAAIDNVRGTDYDDFIRGNALDNTLYGCGGDDTLYGENGNDVLWGGAGNDGLFGGRGYDVLFGESGADRFLVETSEPGQGIPDPIGDPAPQDTTILFAAADKSWTTAEIEQVDQAFAILHKATKNTTLLKLPDGSPMTFTRHSGGDAGYNSGGNIVLSDMVMNGNSLWETGYALHEIGHNWDTENPILVDFLNCSGWVPDYWQLSSCYQKLGLVQINKYGESWWYNPNAAFASNYAKTHPKDDFAESFSAAFLQRAGLGFYNPSDGSGASAIPAKVNLINSWVNSL